MKKIQVLIISIFFLGANVNASFLTPPQPYSFGPAGRTVSDLKDFAKPAQVANILPNRPVCSTDSSGARVYYSSSGRQLFSVSKDGQTTITVGRMTTTRDKEGNITSVVERQRGTNIAEVKDAFGELVGYKTLGANGLTDKEFDKDFNLIKSYNYDKFNKTLTSVVNEVTQEMTLFDRFGREKGVISIGFGSDGDVISTSQYDDISYERSEDGKSIIEVINDSKYADAKLLVTKKIYTITGESFNSDGTANFSSGYNTIYYDREGLTSKVVNSNGITISEYFYKRDNYGNKVLTHVLNPENKSITYYENGKPIEERNDAGAVTKKYYYDGSRLLYTVSMNHDGNFGEVTYYDRAGKAIATTYKFVQYDPSSSERIDFICGTEYSVKLNKDQIKEIEDGESNLKEGKDYIIRTEKNIQTMKDEAVYYFIPDGIEGVNYISKKVENDYGEMEVHFYKITEKYIYDEKGNIDYVINLGDNTRTYYKNNKMYYTAANDDSTRGIVVRDNPNDPRLLKIFVWDKDIDNNDNEASVLRYVFDTKTQTTQWFNANSQFVYLTYNDRLISSNIYDGAKLVGTWNNQTKELTILRDEKQWIVVNLKSEPDLSFIRKVLSFTNGNDTDWTSVNNYVNYYGFMENLLEENFSLVKMVDTFDKYNKLKQASIKELEGTKHSFVDYLKYIDAKKSNSDLNSFQKYLSYMAYKNFENVIKKLHEKGIIDNELFNKFSLDYKKIIEKYGESKLDFIEKSSLAFSLIDFLSSDDNKKNTIAIDYLKYISTENSNINNFQGYVAYKSFNNAIKNLYEQNSLSSELFNKFSALSYKEIIGKYNDFILGVDETSSFFKYKKMIGDYIQLDFDEESSVTLSLFDFLNDEDISSLIEYLNK